MLAKLPLSASLDWLMVFAVGAECCRVQYGFEVGASPEGKMTPWTTSSQVKVKCSMCGSLALFVYSYWSCFLCWRISLHWLRLYKVFNFQNKFLLIQLIKQQVFCLQERVLVFSTMAGILYSKHHNPFCFLVVPSQLSSYYGVCAVVRFLACRQY